MYDQFTPDKHWRSDATGTDKRTLKITMPSVSQNDINGLFRGGMSYAEMLWQKGFRLTVITDAKQYWAAPLSKDGYHDVYGPYETEPTLETLAVQSRKADGGASSPPALQTIRVRGFVLGESFCDAMRKAGLPIKREPGWWLVPTTSNIDEMAEKLLHGEPEATNLVFSPKGWLEQVWLLRRTSFGGEEQDLRGRHDRPSQEEVIWDSKFNEPNRHALWLINNNIHIDLREMRVQQSVPPFRGLRLTANSIYPKHIHTTPAVQALQHTTG
ncbi:MAG TPA: hypothetical protein VKH63_16445 [Candidatus Acidoferrum sp.]|nr:hypothetical protein [Candidatus Acidoferrum sp.]